MKEESYVNESLGPATRDAGDMDSYVVVLHGGYFWLGWPVQQGLDVVESWRS